MSFSSSSEEDGFRTDDSGRRIRIRPRGGPNKVDHDEDDWGGPPPPPATRRNNNKARQQRDQWDDKKNDDDWGVVPSSSRTQQSTSNTNNFGGWDDFDIESIDSDNGGTRAPTRRRRENSSRSGDRNRGRRLVDSRRGGGDRQSSNNKNKNNNDWGRNNRRETSSTTSRIPRQRSRPYSFQRSSSQEEEDPMKQQQQQQYRSINMNGLEASGFVHLYGLASILSALQSERRDLITSEEKSELLSFDDDEYGASSSSSSPPPPPQAQFRPYLFLQDKTTSQRKGSKAEQEQKIIELAEQRGVPIAHVDKGILNTLCGNRPHQGMVLRCGKLYFESMSRIPLPDETDSTSPDLWLVLDEVVDPQNLGALIRSAYFLGHKSKLNVLVCSKNSAPPSPVVSAASAGALELLPLYSTNNLPRTLQHAAEDGFRIIGASSSVPLSSTTTTTREQGHVAAPPQVYDLQDLTPRSADNRPILLVLGSEGHGLRTLVAKACTEFVRIPSGAEANEEEDEDDDDTGGVDSLNVSVTGGIILWHLLRGQ
eukprot:scaffold13207_cov143-Cylindrotheca_fusiformis.AAC.6